MRRQLAPFVVLLALAGTLGGCAALYKPWGQVAMNQVKHSAIANAYRHALSHLTLPSE